MTVFFLIFALLGIYHRTLFESLFPFGDVAACRERVCRREAGISDTLVKVWA